MDAGLVHSFVVEEAWRLGVHAATLLWVLRGSDRTTPENADRFSIEDARFLVLYFSPAEFISAWEKLVAEGEIRADPEEPWLYHLRGPGDTPAEP